LLSDEFIKPIEQVGFYDVFHIFNIRHAKRDELRNFMLENGIKTEIHYPTPPHRQVAMKGVLSSNYPISDEIHSTTLSLPIAFFHNENDIVRVADTLNKWLKYRS
jgi:dTDP-4-amino-4,6-dideoxygalactose transaminase